MGYYNPIYCYGVERFLTDAAEAGVDGLIVVDLPPEHDEELCQPAAQHGIDFIRLATPTTDAKRFQGAGKRAGFCLRFRSQFLTGGNAPTPGRFRARLPICATTPNYPSPSALASVPPNKPPPLAASTMQSFSHRVSRLYQKCQHT